MRIPPKQIEGGAILERGTFLSFSAQTIGAQTIDRVLATPADVPPGTLLSILDIYIRAKDAVSENCYRQSTAGTYFDDGAGPDWVGDFFTEGTFGTGPGGMDSIVGVPASDLIWRVIGIAGVTLDWTFTGILRFD